MPSRPNGVQLQSGAQKHRDKLLSEQAFAKLLKIKSLFKMGSKDADRARLPEDINDDRMKRF